MAATWVAVMIGVLTAVTGGLAGHLTAQKGWHKWAFWASAVFSVGLLVVQGILMQRDIRDAEDRGRQEQAQLNRIEKNTGNPPNVIVNPPAVTVTAPATANPSPVANVVFERFESAHNTVANGRIIDKPLFTIGAPISLNFHFTNIGNGAANGIWHAANIVIATSETEEQIISNFETGLKKQLKAKELREQIQHSGGVLQPGGLNDYWFSESSNRPIQPDDIGKFIDGTQRVYVLVRFFFSDSAGAHHVNVCQWLQAPKAGISVQQPIWHFCDDFKD